MKTKIINGKILTPAGVLEGQSIVFDEQILCVGEGDAEQVIDAKGGYVSPGFIDTHLHGGGGHDFMDGTVEAIVGAAECHLQHGTTTMYPTALSSTKESMLLFLEKLRQVKAQGLARANLPGAHIEGPYFSMEQRGAQNPDYIRGCDPAEYTQIVDAYPELVKRWSFAPEVDGAVEFCRYLVEKGIVPSIAHSSAELSEVEAVYKEGCALITHLYSGMSSIVRKGGFRKLGVVESYYYLDEMYAEIIADGMHLPPELLRLILKQKDGSYICLVTDAMRGAGMPEGPSLLGSGAEAMPCIIEDGVAKLLDRTAFAGSVATADRLVRVMATHTNVGIAGAVRMVTETPARLMGLKTKGRLEAGMDADILIFDENINIQTVFVGGQKIEF